MVMIQVSKSSHLVVTAPPVVWPNAMVQAPLMALVGKACR